jgi:phenylacetate-CoA ligase
MTREAILAFQCARLRRLVAHAYENVPYYRRLFDEHGITPHDIRTAADLALIPITVKRDLRAASPSDIVARGVCPERLIAHHTSGSSGEPFVIRRTWLEERLGTVLKLRVFHDFGLRPTDRQVGVGLVRSRPWIRDLPQHILRGAGFYRWAAIDCRLPIEDIRRTLRSLRPDAILSYPGVIARVAQLLTDEDRRLLRPRLVLTGAEVLTPLMRRQIVEGLRAPVFDWYGSHELGIIAWQCKRGGGFHVADDSLILEILKDGRAARPGETGEVVGTRLHALAMPFIRYKLGDAVVQGEAPCPCGAPFSTIRSVQGRMLDYFPLPDGRVLHPYNLSETLQDEAAHWLGQYQFTQERKDRVILRMVPRVTPSPGDLARVRQALIAHLGAGVELEMLVVPEIAIELSGKFRVSRSLVQSAYGSVEPAAGRST